jgi:hypothetical protein
MDLKIIVATHKPYRMPDDPMYLPVQAGALGKNSIGYARDDEGDNISGDNAYFNESTAIYWAWKHLDADYIGVSHYRRHFVSSKIAPFWMQGKWKNVLSQTDVEKLLQNSDVIVPNKRLYLIETNEQHYANSSEYRPAELELMRSLIAANCSGKYMKAFHAVLKKRHAHMFNMYIMKRDKFDTYCTWMFPLLLEFHDKLANEEYPPKENRAWISELMIDTWLTANDIGYVECNVMYMESQNWVKKVCAMLKRKFER